ncbi:DUF1254 domain-containing protein [Cellulomonas sp. Leaf334]|uniref:DUF1254 domain-containing protein n=1 Tax=Cellulomonas sp. Leaf334 TaxID=1736339 RepID=UPI0006F45E2D|nr:DUF1254 domain-containing protein [Cellulomonas sp. Leaf334]KQR17249.1 hypothetical protein ASF78_08115 [Cellulomonas sp. Leaf334]
MSDVSEPGTEAYLYYYPLVENLRQVRRYTTTGVGSNPPAPFNTFSHSRNLAGPQDTFVTINNDTVYSMAQLDLSIGPVMLDVPATGDRYYVLQFVDAWTNNIAYVGTRATGNSAGRFVVVPPGWDSELPEGVPQIAASTNVVTIVGRIACGGPDDIAAVVALQDGFVLTPPEGTGAGFAELGHGLDDDARFWSEARAWSAAFPPPGSDDDSAYAAVLAAADAPIAPGIERLEYLTHHGSSPVVNGWIVGLHLFDYNVHALGLGTIDEDRWKIADPTARIIDRAVACRLGLWGNHAYEAVYAQAFALPDGSPLLGSTTTTLTFPTPPPVGAFWSITMYDIPRYFLVANSIDRYSVGDRTPGIRYADDGSLTLTISAAEPTDALARANWLPAPSEQYRLVFRLYIPGAAVLDGTYDFPPLVAR